MGFFSVVLGFLCLSLFLETLLGLIEFVGFCGLLECMISITILILVHIMYLYMYIYLLGFLHGVHRVLVLL